jgi:hypothetical protein
MVKHSRRARSVHTRPGFSVNQCRRKIEMSPDAQSRDDTLGQRT